MVVRKVDLEIFLNCRIRKDDKESTLRSKDRNSSVPVRQHVVELDAQFFVSKGTLESGPRKITTHATFQSDRPSAQDGSPNMCARAIHITAHAASALQNFSRHAGNRLRIPLLTRPLPRHTTTHTPQEHYLVTNRTPETRHARTRHANAMSMPRILDAPTTHFLSTMTTLPSLHHASLTVLAATMFALVSPRVGNSVCDMSRRTVLLSFRFCDLSFLPRCVSHVGGQVAVVFWRSRRLVGLSF